MQVIKSDKGYYIVKPDKGKKLTDGIEILEKNQEICLGIGDSPDNWWEISEIINIFINELSLLMPNYNGDHYKLERIYDMILQKNILELSFNSKKYSGFEVLGITGGNYNKIRITYKSNTSIPLKLQFNYNSSVIQMLEPTDEWATTEIDISDIPYINTFELYVQPTNEPCVGTLCISELVAIEDD